MQPSVADTKEAVHRLTHPHNLPRLLEGDSRKIYEISVRGETAGHLRSEDVFPFTNEVEVIALANATEYGLASCFSSRDLSPCQHGVNDGGGVGDVNRSVGRAVRPSG